MKNFCVFVLLSPWILPAQPQVTSTFSILTDMAEQLACSNIMIHSLAPKGVDPHSYKATGKDMMEISKSQMLLYFGNGIDSSAYKIAKKASPNIMDCKAFTHDNQSGLDPHAWQSPLAGMQIVKNIATCLKKILPKQIPSIDANQDRILQELDIIHSDYQKKLATLPEGSKKLLTAHKAFGYLARDFKLETYSVMGFDNHGEPSAQKLQKLVDVINQNKIKVLFPEGNYISSSLKRLTTLTGIKVGPALLSDSLPKDLSKVKNYQEFLKYNLEQIYQTLRTQP